MLKHLMNGSSLIALALRSPDDDAAAKEALRAKIAGNAKVEAKSEAEIEAGKKIEPEAEETEEDIDDEETEEEIDPEVEPVKVEKEETAEAKTEREKQEKIAAKAKRKTDRMQSRIDEATAKLRTAEAETARLKAQLEADPDKKLTAEEIETRAKALAAEAEKTRVLEKLQSDFDKTCEELQKAAKKVDKDFDKKVDAMAKEFGKIPSFMITALSDLENGGEVLAYIANDDEVAEKLYDINNASKLVKELVLISLKLEEDKKPPKKQISKVKAIDPVRNNGGSSQSTVITEADTKNMPNYVQKRMAQREAQRKARGY